MSASASSATTAKLRPVDASGRRSDPAVPDADARAEVIKRRDERGERPPRGDRQYTALQRAELLVDAGSFHELLPSRSSPALDDGPEGVVTGWGHIEGRPVVVISHDFSVKGGSIGAAFADKVVWAQEFGMERRIPILYLNDSGGARIHEGIAALHGCGRIFNANVRARRLVPQVSVILGPCAGAAAYSPALTDWTIMVRERSQMFLTGPEVVRAATGEDVSSEDLGGAALHTRDSGVAHLDAASETEALALARQLISFIPSAKGAPLPRVAGGAPEPEATQNLTDVVPSRASEPFDMRDVFEGVLDSSPKLELMRRYAPSVLVGFGRIDGLPVGLVGSQPGRRGGILDTASAQKASRFVEFCGRFGVPIVTFVDVPGFMPGTREERRGVITAGAELLAAYVDADVPKLTVIIRKAYGGAYIAMGSRSLGSQLTWAWPGAELAVMGPEGAVGILNRRELAAADDPKAVRQELAAGYRQEVTRPFLGADLGIIDDVILPEETREHLVSGLRFLLHENSGSDIARA